MSFKVIGENLFFINFEHSWDKAKVLEGHPWVIEGNLFSVADFDGITPLIQMNFDIMAFWVYMYNLPLTGVGFLGGACIGCGNR